MLSIYRSVWDTIVVVNDISYTINKGFKLEFILQRGVIKGLFNKVWGKIECKLQKKYLYRKPMMSI